MADLDRLVDAAVARFGKIDVLIPNAGILPLRDLESTTEEDFDRTYNLMVKGPYFLAQVCPHKNPQFQLDQG
jgi:3-oxoacyl-[acyl-carrier protein] reductase